MRLFTCKHQFPFQGPLGRGGVPDLLPAVAHPNGKLYLLSGEKVFELTPKGDGDMSRRLLVDLGLDPCWELEKLSRAVGLWTCVDGILYVSALREDEDDADRERERLILQISLQGGVMPLKYKLPKHGEFGGYHFDVFLSEGPVMFVHTWDGSSSTGDSTALANGRQSHVSKLSALLQPENRPRDVTLSGLPEGFRPDYVKPHPLGGYTFINVSNEDSALYHVTPPDKMVSTELETRVLFSKEYIQEVNDKRGAMKFDNFNVILDAEGVCYRVAQCDQIQEDVPDMPSAFVYTRLGQDEEAGRGMEKDIGLCLARNVKNWVVSGEGFMYHIACRSGRQMGAPAGAASDSANVQLWQLDLSVNVCTCNLGPNLLSLDEYWDAVIESADGGRVKAHRAVLSAQSTYFKEELERSKDGLIQLSEPSETIQHMVNFLYTNRFPLSGAACPVHKDEKKADVEEAPPQEAEAEEEAPQEEAESMEGDGGGESASKHSEDGVKPDESAQPEAPIEAENAVKAGQPGSVADIEETIGLFVLAVKCDLTELQTWCKRWALRSIDASSAVEWFKLCLPHLDLMRPVILKCLYYIVENYIEVRDNHPEVYEVLTTFECIKLKAMIAQVLFAFYPTESDMIMFRMIAIQEGVDMQGELIKWLLTKRDEQMSREMDQLRQLQEERDAFLRGGGKDSKTVARKSAGGAPLMKGGSVSTPRFRPMKSIRRDSDYMSGGTGSTSFSPSSVSPGASTGTPGSDSKRKRMALDYRRAEIVYPTLSTG